MHAVRPECNHVAHLLATIFCCPLWLVMWIYYASFRPGWTCTGCGGYYPEGYTYRPAPAISQVESWNTVEARDAVADMRRRDEQRRQSRRAAWDAFARKVNRTAGAVSAKVQRLYEVTIGSDIPALDRLLRLMLAIFFAAAVTILLLLLIRLAR